MKTQPTEKILPTEPALRRPVLRDQWMRTCLLSQDKQSLYRDATESLADNEKLKQVG